MKQKLTTLFLFVAVLLLSAVEVNAQTPNGTCLTADPFCTGTPITFPAGVGTGTAEVGPNYGCLLTQPNPAWYYMEIDQGGNLDIEISNSNNEDIDFICYGPFVDQVSPCTALLTAGNTEDCSYSTTATEICNIVGANPGEFYLLLITNFSNNATDISFQDLPSSTATTNCAIVCPPIDFGVWNGATVEQTPLTMNCDDPAVLLLADEDGFNPGEAISPCVVIQIFPTSTNTTLSVEFFENGTSLGTLFPGASTNWSGYLSLADPDVSHAWVLNEGVAGGGNMTYNVLDCHSGAILATGTWVDDGNPQTVTVNPPPNLSGTATFTVTPASGNPGLTSFDWGGAVWDPSLVPPGSYDITYSWDDGAGNCAGTATHTFVVVNPYDATWTSPGTICESAGSINLNTVGSPVQAGGTWSGTGVSGNTFNPSGLSGPINVTYTVGTGGSCLDAVTLAITVIPDVDPSWTSPGNYCENSGNINLNTLITGTGGGTWSGTGVSGNTFNPTGLSGNIAITYTVGTAPCDEQSTQNINVFPDVDPSWTTPGTICESAGNINLNTTITGTPGGTWSGTGVSGNTFNPTGLSGNISVTYTVGNNPCQEASTQTITVEPDVDPSWTNPSPVCEVSGNINLNTLITGTGGGTWSGTGVSGNTFNPTGLSGSIAVTYTVGNAPCDEQSTLNIVVEPDVDASWTTPGTICENAGNINLNTLITGTTGGSWSGTGVSGNTFNPTGLSGNISVTYTVGNSPCDEASTQTITVEPDVDPSWTTPGTACEAAGSINLNTLITGTTGGSWSGTGVTGNTFNPTGLSGNISVTYTVGNSPCDEASTQTITVEPDVDPAWTTPGAICESGGIIDLSTTITGTTGGTWSGTGVTGSNFDPSGLSGNISVTYTVGNAPCDEQSTQTINVITTPDASWTTPGDYCEASGILDLTTLVTGTTGGTWSGTGVTGNNFDPSGLAGNINITYSVGTVPCQQTLSQNINVVPDVDPSWTIPAALCENDAAIDLDLQITGTGGGTWSGTGVTGSMFDPTGLSGNISVTYTVGNAPCIETSVQNITVNLLDDASFNYAPTTYCQSDANPTPNITGVGGGTFSAPVGVTINSSTGEIDLATSSTGTHTITYSVNSVCANSSTFDVTIIADDDPSFTYGGGTYCLTGVDPSATITGLGGGTFAGTGSLVIDVNTGLIDLDASGLGSYTVTYTTNGPCPQSSSVPITITNAPSADFTFAGPYCEGGTNPLPTFGAGASAGVFSASPAGMVINASTGEIDLTASTPGTYTVTNDIAAAGGCAAASSSTTVTITALDDPTFDYTPDSLCQNDPNPIPNISGTLGGGFTISGAGVITAGTGEIDLLATPVGTYDVTYTTTGACPASLTVQFTIVAEDDPTFDYSDTTFCMDATDPIANVTGTTGGTFAASPVGLTIDPNTGAIDLDASVGGTTYTVTYTTPGICPNTQTWNVTVDSVDNPLFSYSQLSYCTSDPNQFPTIAGTSGGTFSASPAGLLIDSITGEVDVQGSPIGNFTVFYNTNGPCPAMASVPFTITTALDATIDSVGPFCSNDAAITMTAADGGGTWSGPGITDANAGTFDPGQANSGANTIVYIIAGGCGDVDSFDVWVDPSMDATITTTTTSICDGAGTIALTATDAGGTWSGPGVSGTTFDPAAAGGAGIYTIYYDIADPCGDSDSITITVNPLPTAPVALDQTACNGDPVPDFQAVGGGGTFNWYDDAQGTNLVGTGSTFTPPVSGNGVYTYWVSETLGGCEGPLTQVTLTISGPTASFVATPDDGQIPLDVYFDNTSTGGNTYAWDFGHDNQTSTLFDPNYIYTEFGDYTATLTVTDSNGCTDTYSALIHVEAESDFEMPNIFSPNDDGVNDLFAPDAENLVDVQGTIMNRWGEVLYEWVGVNGGWDGHLSAGGIAPEGVYFYIIVGEGADGTMYSAQGHVTLVR